LVLALAFAVAPKETTRLTSTSRTLAARPMLIPLVAAASLFAFIFPQAGPLAHYIAGLGLAETHCLGGATGSLVLVPGCGSNLDDAKRD
jgi:sn-glycerol 3-phosphate transport system permease protein